MFLYRTKFGLNFIEKMSAKVPWLFRMLADISMATGYCLMAGGIYLLVQTVFLIYSAVNVPKIPPLMPLIPYVTNIFKIDFLPPFYFTYWIIAIAIIAISHEFMHGVFARFYKIKLKSTGFGFLGPFLAAFVELDEKKMAKKPIKNQLAILSGGSFANFIFAILFFIILNCFFAAAFMQSGVIIPELGFGNATIPSYYFNIVNASNLTYNNNPLNITELRLENKTDYEFKEGNKSYYMTREILDATLANSKLLLVYTDTPAYKSKLEGNILKINNEKIRNITDLNNTLKKYKPGENVIVETSKNNYTINLTSDPENLNRAVIGIGFPQEEKKGFLIEFIKTLLMRREMTTYYAPLSQFSIFIYNLLLWIVLINISVMLVNMIPFAIFDGGRFFYLTALAITKSKKKSVKWFNLINNFIWLILIALMVIWIFRIF